MYDSVQDVGDKGEEYHQRDLKGLKGETALRGVIIDDTY